MSRRRLRCAIYTRKSTEEGLDQDFNSLDAQREACEAYISSQAGEGWRRIGTRYDDGAYSGGTMDRPAQAQTTPFMSVPTAISPAGYGAFISRCHQL